MNDATIPIGSMVPLHGPSAADGHEFRNGMIMAAEEINQRAGILGKQIVLFFEDTGLQSPAELVRAAHCLINNHKVHAIINGYNIGAQNAEYEAIADAGVIYIHHNTLLQHHDTVMSDPDRYFGCFMGDPAEYWYGQGFIKLISSLRDTGEWKPRNNKIAVISGNKPYSVVIANAMISASRQFGWYPVTSPVIVKSPTDNWNEILDGIRQHDPAVLAVTQYHTGDLARFQIQFMQNPIPSLLYLQYGALHKTFTDIVGDLANGVIVGTMIGLPRDKMGRDFANKYKARFGAKSTPEVGCQPYTSLHHYAIASSIAGATSGPGGAAINRAVAQSLLDYPYRSVSGTIRFHQKWQAAIPYPDAVHDPSLGIPHLFYQIRGPNQHQALIAPEPYTDAKFELPPWLPTVHK
jgi:branched-chain amino acid transport system substrate-binding protein